MKEHERQEDWSTVADAVRARRVFLDLTQADLSERSGLGIQTVRNVESGRSGERRDATLHAIEDALEWPHGTLRQLATATTPSGSVDEARLAAVEQSVAKLSEIVEDLISHLTRFSSR